MSEQISKRNKKRNNNPSFYIAAIGASAGGVEALQKLLSHLPPGMEKIAFVIAQHLSPSYKSLLAETLRNSTQLNIVEVKNSIAVKVKNIYITPPGREIIIRKGKLQLSKPIRTAAARPSIDNLFISLAKDKQEKAIGIILSGTGSDGAIGIKAIKDGGGITFAQVPDSAKYSSMPLASVETGKVDYIIAPENIGSQLKKIVEPAKKTPLKEDANEKEKGLDNIIELLSERTGTDFTNYKINTLARRITRRLTNLKMATMDEYLAYIEKKPEELDELFYTMLIGVTGFFRDAGVFKSLKKHLNNILRTKSEYDPVRVWVVGCATGEEAYSIGISLAMIQKENDTTHPVQIIATDINEHSLNVARKGIYPKKALHNNLPPEILKNYFTAQNGNYEINKTIRSMVLFSRHDISNNPPFLKLDLIVCRNLLIYFNSKLQNRVFEVFHSALKPNGYLLLGKSESVGRFVNLFSEVNRTAKIYQRKAVTHKPSMRYSRFKPNEKLDLPTRAEKTIPEMAKETIFRAFVWPYVVVNDNMDVQEIHGDVSKYMGLKPGQMNANLIRLAHKDIKIELRSLLNKCIADKKEMTGLVKKMDNAGKDHLVKITVNHLAFSEFPNDFYLVIFEEIKIAKAEIRRKFIPSGKNDARRIAELEAELEGAKEDLETFVGKLENTNAEQQSLNEELQAANEELKISNEELETTNEELQSANEEINIAYVELKSANEALEIRDAALRKSETNVNALLSNTMQAFILIDASYRILAFNKMAHKTFKNIFGKKIETGDSFKHLISQDLSEYFANEINEALKGKVIIKEKEIQSNKGKSFGFIMSCMPVLNEEKKVEALSFSLLDITELKKTQSELMRSRELVNSVFHTADIGIAIFDEKGRFIKTNDGFNKLFGYEDDEVNGKHFTIMFPSRDKKEFLEKFKQLLKVKKLQGELLAVKKNGDYFTIYRTAQFIKNSYGSKYIIATVRDISETKKYENLLQHTEKIAHVAGWEMDVLSKKITRTDEFYQIVERKESEINKLPPERSLDIFYDADSRASFRKAKKEAIDKGKAFDLELSVITGRHINKWVRLVCIPRRIKSKTIGLIGFMHDITLQKETQLELERLSIVARKTNNAVFIMDEYGKTVWLNESIENITGLKREEMLGKTLGEVMQGTGADKAIIDRMNKRLKTNQPVSEVINSYKKEGGAFWIKMDVAPVFMNKKLMNFVAIGADITELMKASELEKQRDLLEQQQKLFNTIAKNFPYGIIGVLDKKFHYIFAGGTEIKKLGLTRNDLIGDNIFDHLSEESNAIALPFLTKAFAGEIVTFEAEINGRIYAINAVPLDNDQKESIDQILVVLLNITRRKIAEEEVIEALERQKELNELKSKFVSIASHEFRTPLSTILSSTYLISKYFLSNEKEKADKHIGRIKTAVSELTNILNEFLSAGRIEEGKIRNNITEFNVVEFCEALINEIKLNLKNGQEIIYQHKGKKNIFLLDRQLLKNVLSNLLSNASKYSDEGKKIWLTSVFKNGQMQFMVKDEGIGIPAEDQPDLFQTFFRARNASTIQGTGIGLYIVKRFLDIMGGTIDFSSKLNEGSTFTLRVPVENN